MSKYDALEGDRSTHGKQLHADLCRVKDSGLYYRPCLLTFKKERLRGG